MSAVIFCANNFCRCSYLMCTDGQTAISRGTSGNVNSIKQF